MTKKFAIRVYVESCEEDEDGDMTFETLDPVYTLQTWTTGAEVLETLSDTLGLSEWEYEEAKAAIFTADKSKARKKVKELRTASDKLWSHSRLTPPATLLRTYERTWDIDRVCEEFENMCSGDLSDCVDTLEKLLEAVKKEQANRERRWNW